MHHKIFCTILCILLSTLTNAQAYLGTITRQANFREGPGKEYNIVASLKAQTQIFVVSKNGEDDFYNIIDITSNKHGYVHKDFVILGEEVPASEGGLFTPSGRSGQQEPEVEIYNNTEKKLTLTLNRTPYIFGPQQRQTLILKDTAYEYIASAPNVIPNHGTEILKSNTKYTWQFYIVTVQR